MAGRREVNVSRPEHSWIPFYRGLGRELIEGGWRERQEELVGNVAAQPIQLIRQVITPHENNSDVYIMLSSRGVQHN